MGTNFYWIVQGDTTPTGEALPEEYDRWDPRVHIGKRSAAGWYCYDCGVTLCKGGESAVHQGTHGNYDRCPKCGTERQRGAHNAAMAELGFDDPATRKLTGVQGASSFSWAQDPDMAVATCNAHLWEHVVEDEYGRQLTGQEFLWMLDINCPIRFTHSLGVFFG